METLVVVAGRVVF
jgi:hypothetical protein